MLQSNCRTADKFTSRVESRESVKRLTDTKIYADYEKAFSEASGLPLSIRPVESFQFTMSGKPKGNPFCSLMAKSNKTCAACLCLLADLEAESQTEAHTLRCFAGICDTMVPIRVGEKVIAFLQTGQVMLREPTERDFFKVARRLLAWGYEVDLKSAQEAFFQTRVLKPEQYRAFISMLSAFADHLASLSNEIAIKESSNNNGAISKARKFIDKNYSRPLTLNEAAKTINTSARYFCKIFKKATGMTFVEYVNRLRIEKAKNLLLNPNKRVSEVAFEVGFESLAQFNRSFKKYVGATPTVFRKTIQY